MKIEIVRFKNGNYAVRRKRWLCDYEYLSGCLAWRDIANINYCQVDTYEQALELRDRKTDHGEPINRYDYSLKIEFIGDDTQPKMTAKRRKK